MKKHFITTTILTCLLVFMAVVIGFNNNDVAFAGPNKFQSFTMNNEDCQINNNTFTLKQSADTSVRELGFTFNIPVKVKEFIIYTKNDSPLSSVTFKDNNNNYLLYESIPVKYSNIKYDRKKYTIKDNKSNNYVFPINCPNSIKGIYFTSINPNNIDYIIGGKVIIDSYVSITSKVPGAIKNDVSGIYESDGNIILDAMSVVGNKKFNHWLNKTTGDKIYQNKCSQKATGNYTEYEAVYDENVSKINVVYDETASTITQNAITGGIELSQTIKNGNRFLGYYINSKLYTNEEKLTFKYTKDNTNTTIEAFYARNDEKVVKYYDVDNILLHIEKINVNDLIDEYKNYTWKDDQGNVYTQNDALNVTKDLNLYLNQEKSLNEINIKVENGTLLNTAPIKQYDKIKVQAIGDFTHWNATINGVTQIISFDSTFEFAATCDMTLTAVNDASKMIPSIVLMPAVKEITETNFSFVGTIAIPQGYTLIERGMEGHYSESDSKVVKVNKIINDNNYRLQYKCKFMNVNPAKIFEVTAYIIYKDSEGNVYRIDSQVQKTK